MTRAIRTAGWRTLPWLLVAALAVLAIPPNAQAQTASCNITYTWPTWVGGNGFGASIDIRNTGPTINGWTLVFNFPNGQRLQNGWPVTFTQPANSATLTIASDADWNRTIATNGVFTVGFNGTFTGTNNPPAQFTLNGTVCTVGNSTNTAPQVQITAPTAGQTLSGTAFAVTATASDPGGAVARVEFRVDGTLLATDTTAPYGFTLNPSTLTAGSHTLQATAVDNGTPALTAVHSVNFTIGGGGNVAPQVSLTSPTANQNFASGAAVPLAATASDPGGAVVRVEFRVDGTLVASDTSSPLQLQRHGPRQWQPFGHGHGRRQWLAGIEYYDGSRVIQRGPRRQHTTDGVADFAHV